jgi:dipeptidyl aminopeptidase/acylaminoacyl peptidase
LQLHHGTADHTVPLAYSERLHEQMLAAGKTSENFVYQGDDHDLAQNLSTALARSVEFFDRYVKGSG